jgi:putative DNA primase/helicase
MPSNELLEFNKQFPNSKYREIHAQYIGDITNDDEREKYQKSKAPINTKILSFDEIKDTKNRIGWIVPNDYIVIDIDNKTNARIVFDILQASKINFSFMRGRKGGHFIFKNDRNIKSISAGQYCSLGIVVDVRCSEKGYIILPENDTDRHWGTISNSIDSVPFFLIPLDKFKAQSDFVGMGEGSGRNDALLKHMLSLIDYAKALTLDEKCESIRLINTYLFEKPLTDIELQKTVLRDDILKKQDDSDGEKTCYEEKIASRIIKDKQIITCDDVCYMFNGKYYKKVLEETEIERIIHLEYNSGLKEKQRKEILKFIKLKSWIASYELNKNWNEIVFRNGILNLASMRLTPHTPSVYNTVYIDCNYIQDAPYSQIIDGFFNQISSCEEDKKNLLYEIIGYCLIRKTVFEKFFICYGEGQTGKSTYLTLIKNLIGNTNSSFISLNDLEKDYMPAELFGKLVNIGDDIAYKGLKETDILKKLVTGQMFAAQRKYKSPINFSNFAKLIFTTNRLPEVYDRSTGFYRRVMIIDINKKIEHPDPFFLDRLTEQDYEYLLSVAIEKLSAALKTNKLTECKSSVTKLEEYKTEQSSVLSFMKEFNYKKSDLDHRPCGEMFKEYEQFCYDTGFKPLKKVKFDREICEEYKLEKKNTTWNKDNYNQCWRFVDEHNRR